MHTHCLRCHRPLHTQQSRTRGYGPKCARRNATQVMAAFKPEQITAAFQLIDDGAIIPLRPGRVWLTVSTDGQSIHRTAVNACTCPAGIRGTRCYHTAAVALLAN